MLYAKDILFYYFCSGLGERHNMDITLVSAREHTELRGMKKRPITNTLFLAITTPGFLMVSAFGFCSFSSHWWFAKPTK